MNISDDRRYSQHARRALVTARTLAEQFSHASVTPDHLLLAIWRTEGSVGHRVLSQYRVDGSFVDDTVRGLHLVMDEPVHPAPYSKELQYVLAYAADESYWLGHHYIGTEHILLGLVRSGTGQLPSLLFHLQISSHQVRQHIRALVSEGIYESNLEAVRRSARLSELSRRVLNAATRVATENHHKAVGLEHLLLALARERRSIAARLLADTGLHISDLTENMRGLQPDPVLAATALEEIMQRAIGQTETLGAHYIGTDHMLLAMTMDDEAVMLMRKYGVNVSALQVNLYDALRR